MFRMIFDYMRTHRWRYIGIGILMVLYNICVVLPTRILQEIVDRMTKQTLTTENLVRDLLLLVAAAVFAYVSGATWNYAMSKSAIDFRYALQMQSFRKLLWMRTPFYEAFRSGDLLTRFTTDVDNLMTVLGYGLFIIIGAGGYFLFALLAMLVISWQITLLALIPMALMFYLLSIIGKKQDIAIEENREAVAQLNDQVLEVVEGIRVTRAYSKKAVQSRLFGDKTRSATVASDKITSYQALYNFIIILLLACSTSVILWQGSQALQAGQVTLGQIVALQLYLVSLIEPCWSLADGLVIYQTGKVAFEKINELNQTGDGIEREGQLVVHSPKEWSFRHYHFAYPQAEKESLVDINWTLQAGQTVGIVGKTGSGKTTLVRQFLRQYPLGQGQLSLDGHSLADYQIASLESLLGYVPQEHILFSKTVGENVALGKRGAETESILQAIETADFSRDLEAMADGLDTLIGERGVSISGGQKQRISLARAFLRQPELLILDDSLSAVDAKTEQNIIQNLQKKRAGKTTLIVTHRLSAIQHADWVLVLDEGRIVEEGRPASLLANKGWYYEQYLRQQAQEGGQV